MSTAVAEAAAWREALEKAPRAQGSPAWLGELRDAAHERFETLGFPTPRNEAWRFTRVSEIADTSFALADPGAAVATDQLPQIGTDAQSPRIVVVNGRLRRELSTGTPQGVRVLDLAEALANEERVAGTLGRLTSSSDNPFAALNTALFSDAVVVLIEEKAVVEHPLHMCIVATGAGGDVPVRSHPRLLVLAGRRSQARVVVSHVGVDGGRYLTNPVTEVFLEEGAVLDLIRDQREHAEALHVGEVAVEQGRSSRFRDALLDLGGRLVRHDLTVRLGAAGAECELLGLFAGSGGQHLATHSFVDHAAPHTTSRELYKGILGGRARGVFHGHVLVRPDAQKIDAEQTNRNLLLTAHALVNSTPALEIRADDVKCKHGSTTGQIDDLAVFYLRSRGLDEAAARGLLTRAFAGDIVGRLKLPALQAIVEARVDQLASEAVA